MAIETVINAQSGETTEREFIPSVDPVASQILKAPAKGFGGPTMKELINGNR